MNTRLKVAALVILYNPNNDNIEAINSYASEVGKLYVFDNSRITDNNIIERLMGLGNVEYITENKNLGLPVPINMVADKAKKEGYNWLITFDHDSRAASGMIKAMCEFTERFEKIHEIGIISPLISDGKLQFAKPASEFSYYDRVIQSGAMHNLDIMEKIGGYDEKLFIDQVDFEYCMRVLKNGYKIVRLNEAVLIHNVKDEKAKVEYIGGRKITKNKYSPIRYYYITRNNLYCGRKYKKFFPPYYAETKRNIEVLKETLPYEEDKKSRRKAILWGYLDFFFGKMGECKRKIK